MASARDNARSTRKLGPSSWRNLTQEWCTLMSKQYQMELVLRFVTHYLACIHSPGTTQSGLSPWKGKKFHAVKLCQENEEALQTMTTLGKLFNTHVMFLLVCEKLVGPMYGTLAWLESTNVATKCLLANRYSLVFRRAKMHSNNIQWGQTIDLLFGDELWSWTPMFQRPRGMDRLTKMSNWTTLDYWMSVSPAPTSL